MEKSPEIFRAPPRFWRVSRALGAVRAPRIANFILDLIFQTLFYFLGRPTTSYINAVDGNAAHVVWLALHGSVVDKMVEGQRVRVVWASVQGFQNSFHKVWRKRTQVFPWVAPSREAERQQLMDASIESRHAFVESRAQERLNRLRFSSMPVGLVHRPGAEAPEASEVPLPFWFRP